MITLTNNLEKTWENSLKLIKSEIPSASFQAWIKPAKLKSIDGNNIILTVRNEFNRNLLLQNYYSSLLKALSQTTNISNLNLIIEIDLETTSQDYMPVFSSIEDINIPIQTSPKKQGNNKNSNLNSKFTFETFVVGTHNQFCHAAALAISQDPKKSPYNPFFIYGGVGLGKTHIMHAIGNYVLKNNAKAKILYITTENFLNDLIFHMRQGKMNDFRSHYRGVDLLLIDDIQFIEGKESTQQEFFHTFNALKDQGSQIILTSDRPPKAISKLEPRLCSRFEGGLVADIQPPTFETRLAILFKKAEELPINLFPQIAKKIAESFPENIRSLEGALAKVAAYANFTNETLSIEFVEKILQIKKTNERLIDKIINSVVFEMNLDKDDLVSASKNKNLVQARQACVYLGRYANLSWAEISQGLGGRGNSSLINLHRKTCEELEKKDRTSNLFNLIEKLKDNMK